MKNKLWAILPAFLMAAVLLSSCAVIGGIFKAGVWTGIIAVIFIVLIVIFIISKLFSKNKNG